MNDKTVIQIRKWGVDKWVLTERHDLRRLGGPDRVGNHRMSFSTATDAAHAAQWRVQNGLADEVERGPAW